MPKEPDPLKEGVLVLFKEGRQAANALGIALPSESGGRLQSYKVFGELAADEFDDDTVRVKITLILDATQAKEEVFYPPLKGRFVDCPKTHVKKANRTEKQAYEAIAEKLKNRKAFVNLQKFDWVIIRTHTGLAPFIGETLPQSAKILAQVINTDRRATDDLVEVKLRRIIRDVTSKNEIKWTLKTQIDQFGFETAVPVYMRPEDIRHATPEDLLEFCANPTRYDKWAFYYPAYLLSSEYSNDWVKAKEAYKNGDLSFNFGGMDALLQYRAWLTEDLTEKVADLALLNAKNERMHTWRFYTGDPLDEGANDDDVSDALKTYVEKMQRMGWDAPGSTEATSDIDLNTWGHGTEWGVKAFNTIFALLHDGLEAGIVYDVNLYAKDFLPRVNALKIRDTEKARYLDPIFDHRLTDHALARTDAINQLQASLLHMHRYMTDEELGTYKQFIDSYQDIHSHLSQSVRSFTANINKLDSLKEYVKNDKTARGELVYQTDAAVQMAAENRIYEDLLRPAADLRNEFDYFKYVEDQNVDRVYCDLRKAVVDALYFANEAYVTEGAIMQVVGGKQNLSAGVTVERDKKTKAQNLKYTADQLFHSMNEQIGDFFKESTRHFHHEHVAEERGNQANYDRIYGEAIIATGKYLHRYFNAMKYLYAIIESFELVYYDFEEPIYQPEDLWTELSEQGWDSDWDGFPDTLIKGTTPAEKKVAFNNLRRNCGFGLEALKKFKPEDGNKKYSDTKKNYKYLAGKLGIDPAEWETNSTFDAEKFGQKDAIASRVINERFGSILQGNEFVNVDSLPKLKTALLKIHAEATEEYLIYKKRTDPHFLEL